MASKRSNTRRRKPRHKRSAHLNLDHKSPAESDPFESSPILSRDKLEHLSRAPCLPTWDVRREINDLTTFLFQNPGTWKERFLSDYPDTNIMGSGSSSFTTPSSPKDQPRLPVRQTVPDVIKSRLGNPLTPHIKTRCLSATSDDLSSRQRKKREPQEPTKPLAPCQLLTDSPSSVSNLMQPSVSKQSWSSSREICEVPMIRGLVNKGNTCFINVILQSLLSCEAFRRAAMITEMGSDTLIKKFSRLAWEMSGYETAGTLNGQLNRGSPLIPDWFFGIFPPSDTMFPCALFGSTQEDAEEFLSFLLNKLHEEELSNNDPSPNADSSCRDGWDTSCEGQRFLESSISKIFGGSLLDEVRKPNQAPSVREESFFSLSFNISNPCIATIDDAIRSYFQPEILMEDCAPIGKSKMIMQKQAFLKKAPQVLILHIKRFSYRNGLLGKVSKRMKFPEVLHIPDSVRKHMNDGDGTEQRSYELTAMVTHIGPTVTRGHYVCDVRLKTPDGGSVWVNCNDSLIREVQLDDVLSRQAYLLFYSII